MIDIVKPAVRRTALAFAGLAAIALPCGGAFGQSGSDFYSGKTITVVVGTGAGGSYATTAQLLVRHWASHIPGSPTIVVQAMPGGGGIKMAGYFQHVAAKDGSVIGMPVQTVALAQVLQPKLVKYDVRDWQWIGNFSAIRQALVVTPSAGVKTIEEARKKQVIIGATGKNGNLFMVPKMAKELAGANLKIVLGYRGGADLDKASESNEIQGRGSSWEIWTMQYPHLLKEGKVIPLSLSGLEPDPDFPKVPLLRDQVSTPLDKKVVDLFSYTDYTARPFAAPPGATEEVVEILRTSFDATMKDKKLMDDAAKRNIPMKPQSWKIVQKAVLDTLDADPKVVSHMTAILAR